jgi:hypothetical protein
MASDMALDTHNVAGESYAGSAENVVPVLWGCGQPLLSL